MKKNPLQASIKAVCLFALMPGTLLAADILTDNGTGVITDSQDTLFFNNVHGITLDTNSPYGSGMIINNAIIVVSDSVDTQPTNNVGTVGVRTPADNDGDGLLDDEELAGADGDPSTLADNTNPLDADSDDDGLSDGAEVRGRDGNQTTVVDNTNPNARDTDKDGLQDGTELGVATPIPPGMSKSTLPQSYVGTNTTMFVPDADPTSVTEPWNPDTDGGGSCDGNKTVGNIIISKAIGTEKAFSVVNVSCRAGEDYNVNGAVDANERNPVAGQGADDFIYKSTSLQTDTTTTTTTATTTTTTPPANGNTEENTYAKPFVSLQLKAILQGAYDSGTHLMSDTLRSKGYLPTTQPYGEGGAGKAFGYSGAETIAPDLLTTEGNNAPVDWVLVELRKTDGETRVSAIAGLLQRDGDIMDSSSGETTLKFMDLEPGSYHVTLNHRNHLGIMTQRAIPLSINPVSIDFTQPTTRVYGKNARLETKDIAILWAGDANYSNTISTSGQNNDVTKILTAGWTSNLEIENGQTADNYAATDINMDGKIIYNGPNNDINILLGNTILHPANINFITNYMIKGRLPAYKPRP